LNFKENSPKYIKNKHVEEMLSLRFFKQNVLSESSVTIF